MPLSPWMTRATVLALVACLGCGGAPEGADAAIDATSPGEGGDGAADIGVLADGGDAALCPKLRPADYSPCPQLGLSCEIPCRGGMDDLTAYRALCTKVGWSATGNCAKDGG